jgi:hypothetical protein
MSEQNSLSHPAPSAKKVAPAVVPISPKPIKSGEPADHRGRHAAITSKINDWNNYRQWVQTTRDTWKKDDDKGVALLRQDRTDRAVGSSMAIKFFANRRRLSVIADGTHERLAKRMPGSTSAVSTIFLSYPTI